MSLVQLSPFATGPRPQRPAWPTRIRGRANAFSVSHPKCFSSQRKPPCHSAPYHLEGDLLTSQQQQPQQQPRAPGPLVPLSLMLRTSFFLASTVMMLAPSSPSPALARMDLPNKEVDDATSPLVQKLLKRTEENRERYKRERLQDYYRRNFKEYFEFEASSAKVARARGLSAKSQEAIAKWLQENK